MKTYKQVSRSRTEICQTPRRWFTDYKWLKTPLTSNSLRIPKVTCGRVFKKSVESTLNIRPFWPYFTWGRSHNWGGGGGGGRWSQFDLPVRLRSSGLKFSALFQKASKTSSASSFSSSSSPSSPNSSSPSSPPPPQRPLNLMSCGLLMQWESPANSCV